MTRDNHATTTTTGRGRAARSRLGLAALAAACGAAALHALPAQAADSASFRMVRTRGLPAACAPNASAAVRVESLGGVERLRIVVSGFPAGTPLVLFTIQVPNFPFGVGWYQSDLTVGRNGTATGTIQTRLNVETFAVAVGAAPAPATHGAADATTNPVFRPVHTYHLGIWFDSVEAARRAGCPTIQTPFNGDHTAGVQVLNTGTFPDGRGPLSRID